MRNHVISLFTANRLLQAQERLRADDESSLGEVAKTDIKHDYKFCFYYREAQAFCLLLLFLIRSAHDYDILRGVIST